MIRRPAITRAARKREKILALHAEKRELADAVLAGAGAAARMSGQELLRPIEG